MRLNQASDGRYQAAWVPLREALAIQMAPSEIRRFNFFNDTSSNIDIHLDYRTGNAVMGTVSNNVLWSLALVLFIDAALVSICW